MPPDSVPPALTPVPVRHNPTRSGCPSAAIAPAASLFVAPECPLKISLLRRRSLLYRPVIAAADPPPPFWFATSRSPSPPCLFATTHLPSPHLRPRLPSQPAGS